MQTRSQTKANKSMEYEVNIDFDYASSCWRQNKKSIGNGSYKYICTVINKLGEPCGKNCYKQSDCCWAHRKLANK